MSIKVATTLTSLLLLAGPATSQTALHCTRDWTPVFCYNELRDQLDQARTSTDPGQADKARKEEAAAAATDASAEDVNAAAKKSTSSTVGDGGALRSFLQPVLATLGFDGIQDSGGQLTFEKTWMAASSPTLEGRSSLRFSLRGTVLQPKVFEPLDTKLREELDQDAAGLGLTEKLGDFDAVDLELAVDLESRHRRRRYGRDPRSYHDLYGGVFEDVLDQQGTPTGQTPLFDLMKRLEGLGDGQLDSDYPNSLTFEEIEATLATNGATRQEAHQRTAWIENEVVRAATGMDTLVAAIDTSWARERGRLDDLVANQPQLGGSVTVKRRGGLSGPDERAATFRYEVGLSGNVNDFTTWRRKNACTQGTLVCLSKYLDERPKAAQNGNRLSVALSFTDTDEFAYPLPDRGFDFELPATQKWTGSLSYGRYVPGLKLFDAAGEDGTRFDLEAKYDDPSGDAMRHSRFVATATLTQRLVDGAELTVGAVWANHPEFRGEVDAELSARFGLTWKRIPKKP